MHSIDIIMDNAGFYETWGVIAYVPTFCAAPHATRVPRPTPRAQAHPHPRPLS